MLDSGAVAAASQEVIGTRLFQTGVHAAELRTSLVVMISYAGFWVSAMAVLPISPTAEVYGLACANGDPSFVALLERTMLQHGFAVHPVGDVPDEHRRSDSAGPGSEADEPRMISTGLGVAGYCGEDGRLYLVNLDRVCPADLASSTAAETNSSVSVHGCTPYLRPELVRSYQVWDSQRPHTPSILITDALPWTLPGRIWAAAVFQLVSSSGTTWREIQPCK